jgi:hypothetical protein
MSNPQEVCASYVDGQWRYTVTGYGYASSNEALEAGGKAALKINPPELAPPAASAFVEFETPSVSRIMHKDRIRELRAEASPYRDANLYLIEVEGYNTRLDIDEETYDRLRRELLGL